MVWAINHLLKLFNKNILKRIYLFASFEFPYGMKYTNYILIL